MFTKRWILYICVFLFMGCDQYQLTENTGTDLSSFSLKNCQYVRNSSGQIVSWKSVVPIYFYLTTKIPEEWRAVIKEAGKAWVSPLGVQLIRFKDEISTSENPSYDKKNKVYWIDSGTLFNYQQAQTITRWIKNQIQDADVLINGKDFSYFGEVADSNRKIHLKSLMIHEFGHALGLIHVPLAESVMYPELSFVQIRANLSEGDATSVKCEYP